MLKALERRLVELVATVIRLLNPELESRLIKPLTMTVFGALNWHYMWFREGGAVTREDYAKLATTVLATGIAGYRPLS
jgi:TetR/AcrR family transcriptional regulator